MLAVPKKWVCSQNVKQGAKSSAHEAVARKGGPINKSHRETRQRFTLAHELGHLVLHSFDDLHYDRKEYGSGFGRVRMRDSESSTGENRDEVEANFFAAELLMPGDLLYQELKSRETHDFLESDFDAAVKLLAKQFKVSPQALTVRLVQIGILSAD